MRPVEEMMQTESRLAVSGSPTELTTTQGHRLLTVAEAANEVRCHEESIRRAYRASLLTVVAFGRRNWRVRRSDLWAWQAAGMKTRQ
jgi:excisionase family DNA binding protein